MGHICHLVARYLNESCSAIKYCLHLSARAINASSPWDGLDPTRAEKLSRAVPLVFRKTQKVTVTFCPASPCSSLGARRSLLSSTPSSRLSHPSREGWIHGGSAILILISGHLWHMRCTLMEKAFIKGHFDILKSHQNESWIIRYGRKRSCWMKHTLNQPLKWFWK